MADTDLDLNVTATPLSSARQVRSTLGKPRAKVTANGTPLRWSMVEVVNTANHQSDSFMVRLPLFDPKAAFDWAWWASQAPVEIEISVGFADQAGASTALTRLILGKVERVDLVPLPHGFGSARGSKGGHGAFVELTGGDYSRALMNSQVSQEFVGNDLTPSQ